MAISSNKYENTIDLLKIFVDFLEKTSSKKGNISLIKEQIGLLDYAFKNEIDLLKIIRDEKNKKNIKEKFIKFSDNDFIKISKSIKDSNEQVDDSLIKAFYRQLPNLKIVKSSNFEKDFKHIEFENWKTDELKFILLHFFSSFPKGKKTKKEMFDLIIEYLYQRKYIESVEKTYSKQDKE